MTCELRLLLTAIVYFARILVIKREGFVVDMKLNILGPVRRNRRFGVWSL